MASTPVMTVKWGHPPEPLGGGSRPTLPHSVLWSDSCFTARHSEAPQDSPAEMAAGALSHLGRWIPHSVGNLPLIAWLGVIKQVLSHTSSQSPLAL